MKESNHTNSDEISLEDDKALWSLLGQAKKPEASPFFARNVVRDVRLLSEEKTSTSWFLSLFKNRGPILAGFAAVILLAMGAFLFNNEDNGTVASNPAATESADFAEDIFSIDELGDLMAVSDPSVLSDEVLLSLIY